MPLDCDVCHRSHFVRPPIANNIGRIRGGIVLAIVNIEIEQFIIHWRHLPLNNELVSLNVAQISSGDYCMQLLPAE